MRRRPWLGDALEGLAHRITEWTGGSWAFGVALATIVVWGVTGPVFGFSDTWQLVINTGTTVVTFLMVFLIQRSQNKDSRAVHLKLNEMVAALQGASNRLINVEDLTETEIRLLHEHYQRLVTMAKRDVSLTESHSVDEAEERHRTKARLPKPVVGATPAEGPASTAGPAAGPGAGAAGHGSPVTSRPVQIVVTPGSGAGLALVTARGLRRRLASRGRETGIRSFDTLGALTQWAETCEPEFSHLVCIGGDATLSAAARAAIRHGVPFVPVPTGFGNVFAGVFGHPQRARDVAALIEIGEVRRVDVGLARHGGPEEVFLSHRSFGVLEHIQQAAEQGRQQPRTRFLRYFWYWGVAYRFFFRTRLAAFTVEIDGTPVADDAVLVTVANVETYRGFLPLTPTVVPIDGLLNVAVVPRVSQVVLLARLLQLAFRLPGRWRGLRLYRGRRVVVTTPRRREELAVRRRALPLLVPPGALEDLQRRTIEDEAASPA